MPERASQKGEKMRKAAMLLLVALLVGALPAAATPISMFPEPFVKAGTIYTADGKATMAIIIGDKAASVDMIGAAMLAMKIGSHLYYTNAPYVDVEDAAAHGITLYYGGLKVDSYSIAWSKFLILNATDGTPFVWNTTTEKEGSKVNAKPGMFFRAGPGLIVKDTTVIHCNPDVGKAGYDYVIMPLDWMSVYPASFHYILGENVTSLHRDLALYAGTGDRLSGKGFFLQYYPVELSNTTGDINIPWLGFKLHVNMVKIDKSHNYALLTMIDPSSGSVVAYLNITANSEYTGEDYNGDYGNVTVIGDPNIYVGTKCTVNVGGIKYSECVYGVPYFAIDSGLWKPLPGFGVIIAAFNSAHFTANATTMEIGGIPDSTITALWGPTAKNGVSAHYPDAAKTAAARFNKTIAPVSGAWGIFNVSGDSNGWTYIWSADALPWFKGNVNAYFFAKPNQMYVFNGSYGIDKWEFNVTKHIGCYDYIFTSIGNRTEVGKVTCPLTEKPPKAEYYCTYICGAYAGVYWLKTDTLESGIFCPYFKTEDMWVTDAYGGAISLKKNATVVTPSGVTGVFSGIFDRFENVSGFRGTTQIKVETSGNVTYAKDITTAADVDQNFEGEAVFSFVKMPIIYLDSWVFANNTLSADLADKNLILIGGPAVNTIVKYLNDAKLLDVTFKQVAGVWTLEYAGKTYDLDAVLKILVDQGYIPAPISKDYIYRVEGGNGLGVIEYAKKNPFGSGRILVVAGTDRYGTLAASVALADPTKLVSSTAPVFYAAGRTAPNAVIVLGIKPTVPPAPLYPAVLTPVIVAIPAGAAG